MANQGGTHDQHVKAGQKSHKKEGDRQQQAESGGNRQQGDDMDRGGMHDQHQKGGQPSDKNK